MQQDWSRPTDGYTIAGQSWALAGRSPAANAFIVVGLVLVVAGILFYPLWVLAIMCFAIGLLSGRYGELTVTWTPAVGTAVQPTPQPVAQPDHAASLEALKALYDRGVLTDEEYAAKRKDILDRI